MYADKSILHNQISKIKRSTYGKFYTEKEGSGFVKVVNVVWGGEDNLSEIGVILRILPSVEEVDEYLSYKKFKKMFILTDTKKIKEDK